MAKGVIALSVLAAVVVGGNLLFGGNDEKPGPNGTKVDPATPSFDFKVTKAAVIPVSPDQQRKKLQAAATTASTQATSVIDAIYTESFLDPSSWQNANYDEAWAQFTQDAATQAQADADTLTAGPGAGDAYDTIEPLGGKVKPRVLVDEKGQPLSIMAAVSFNAKGVHADGTYTMFRSSGDFFLRKIGDAWKVIAFQVRRADSEEAAPPPSASGSGTVESTS